MKGILLVALLFGVSLACLYEERDANGKFSSRTVHWSYEGDSGPDHWADLDPSWSLCGVGKKQTPIDIASHSAGATSTYHIGDLTFNGHMNPNVKYDNNGHTVVVTTDRLNNITGGPMFSDVYSLVQFHFHGPAEHSMNGVFYPLEVHFVHQNPATGELAVVGVFFELGTTHNDWLGELFDHLPDYQETRSEPSYVLNLNPYAGLPEDKSYYHYQGSLTTPPCTEGLKWMVMQEVLEITPEQLDQWEAHVAVNNRPIQARNGRQIFVNNEGDDACPMPEPTDGDNGSSDGDQEPSNGKSETVINFNFANMFPSL